MSEEQLSALLAKLKEDAELQDKLIKAADLDAAVAIAQEAGFDVSKEDWLRSQANQNLKLSDADLETVAGGGGVGADDAAISKAKGMKQTAYCNCPSNNTSGKEGCC